MPPSCRPDTAEMPINPRDPHEIRGGQARAADEGAVDVRNAHQFGRVAGFHRSAVEDSHPVAHPRQMRVDSLADESMHPGDIMKSGRQAGPDRPDWLIGDDEALRGRSDRNGAGQLGGDDRQGLARLSLGPSLADADDRRQTGPEGGVGLVADAFISLIMPGPALRMAENDVTRPRVPQHFRGNVAGEGSARLVVTVLPAKPHAGAGADRGRCGEQSRRQAKNDLRAIGAAVRHFDADLRGFDEILAEAVHFPVSRDERTAAKPRFSVHIRNASGSGAGETLRRLQAQAHLLIVPAGFVNVRLQSGRDET